MTNSNKPKTTGYKLTDADFKQINRRSLFGFQLGWNYERMQASGYLYTILPQLRKMYGDGTPELKKMMKLHTQFFNTSNFFNTIVTGIDLALEDTILPQLRKMYGDGTPELKKMMKLHTQFFNTSNFFNTIVTGIDLALEEEEGTDSAETVNGLKAGLMGPFAAIGDAIFATLIPAIFGAIAADMAVKGNPLGVLIWVGASIAVMIFRWSQLKFAYKEGTELVTTMQHRLTALTDAATQLGVFMGGALVATMINVKLAWAPMIGMLSSISKTT